MLPFFFTHFINTFFQIASILKHPEESKEIARGVKMKGVTTIINNT
jgi:hypothetical protein